MGERCIKKRSGYVLITPTKFTTPTPITCPTCQLVMSTSDDLVSYGKWGCCSWCERMWVQGINRERWKDGWRPDVDVIDSTLRGLGLIEDVDGT